MKDNKIKKKRTKWNYNMGLKSVVVSQAEKEQLLHISLHETQKNSAEYGDWRQISDIAPLFNGILAQLV
ncbi:MAG: hypothetical protein RIM83_07650 [Allomuricauda sp.]